MERLLLRNFAVVSVAAVLLACAPLASAQGTGYDLLQTLSGASISVPGVSPNPIALQGVPICPCTGLTDTIMHRTAVAPGGRATLDVVALFLKNSAPVTRGGSPVDVYITVNQSDGVIGQNTLPQPDALPRSTGSLTIRPDGTFDSSFTVHADIIIVAAGADVRNPPTHIAHMGGGAGDSRGEQQRMECPPTGWLSSGMLLPGQRFLSRRLRAGNRSDRASPASRGSQRTLDGRERSAVHLHFQPGHNLGTTHLTWFAPGLRRQKQ